MKKTSFQKRLGRCYELSGKWIIDHPKYRLVHGRIHYRGTAHVENPHLDHGWVETDSTVFDPVMNLEMPRFVYDQLFHAERFQVYDHETALRLMLRHKHFGPWEKEST